jgi:threonine dehydrogenase-like Zn-dependent dehydrogenase
MKAVIYNGTLRLEQVPKPVRDTDEVLIKATKAGICNTDHEIIRGYIPGFNGIPGHEFIGIVEEADDTSLVGKRATAEINCACGTCEFCRKGLGRHCPTRTVIGIINQNGAFAEYIAVPRENCVIIPDTIPDNRAIFIEPLAAALEILEQVSITPDMQILLFGDGKLGLLIAHVLATTKCGLTVVGMSPKKLSLLDYTTVKTVLLDEFNNDKYDIVIEATGNSSAFERAIHNVKPRGILVIKSTYAHGFQFNPSSLVVDEITIIGSRCGLFSHAIEFLSNNDIALERMISREFALEDVVEAFEYSSQAETLKVVLRM